MEDDEALSKLVQRLVNAPIGSSLWKRAYNKAANILRYEKVTSSSENEVNDRFSGLVDKFNIMGHQQFSDSLQELKGELFKSSRPLIPDEKNNSILKHEMLHMLLSLSSSAHQDYTNMPILREAEPKETELTWEDIIRDDPLDGDHWKVSLEDSSHDEEYFSESEDMNTCDDEYNHRSEQQPLYEDTPRSNAQIDVGHPNDMDIDDRADQEGLNMLVSQQYWRNDYHMADDSLTEPTALLQNPCQTSKAAEWFQHGNNSNNIKSIPEADIMREVLSLYKGHEGIIFVKRGNKLMCNEEYSAQHVSAGALNNLLREFCTAANLLEELRQHTDRNLHLTDLGKTNQAFAEAINHLLNDFDQTISEMEKSTSYITENASQMISLLKLRSNIEPSLQCFHILHEIIAGAPYNESDPCALSVYLISSIYDQALTCQSFQQLQTFDILLDVLNKTMVPYSRLMDEWVYNGSLAEDVVEEFFVSRNADVLVDSPDFWLKGYSLKPVLQHFSANFENPLFEELFLNQVFFSGKAVSLLSKLHKMGPLRAQQSSYSRFSQSISAPLGGRKKQTSIIDRLHNQQKSDNRDIFTKSLFPLAGASRQATADHQSQQKTEETTKGYAGKMVKQELARCLRMYIERPYNSAAYLLNEVLQNECGLQSQLMLFASIYLMLDNNLMHSFCQTLFDQMDADEAWFSQRSLNQTFRDTCELNGYHEAAFIELSYEEHNDTPSGMKADRKTIASYLEQVTFNVEIPWPLNNFIHIERLADYAKVQRFLLRLKRAKYVMEKNTLFRDKKTRSNERAMYFYSLRLKMISLINSFWRYIMTTILHAETIDFRRRLSALKDADEIASLHDAYVRRIVDRCLLNDKATAIKKSIVSIFDLAEHMAVLFKNYLKTTTMENEASANHNEQFDSTLKKIEDSFNRSSDFISTSLTIMGRKANMPWFEALGASLSSSKKSMPNC